MKPPKNGLIVTIIICAVIVLLRDHIPAMAAMTLMAVRGQARYCPFFESLSSSVQTARREKRIQELQHEAKLLNSDPGCNLEHYSIGTRDLWIPAGELESAAAQVTEQQYGIYESTSSKVRAGNIVLDIGANIGVFTRHALEQGAARVIAMEPEPVAVECLRRNLKTEIESGRVIVYTKGAWDKPSELEMSVRPGLSNGASFVFERPGGRMLKLPVTTIDLMARELNITRVDFIKMDIEGAERRALVGAAQTIHSFRPEMAICVYHVNDDPVVIPATIKAISMDYRQKCGSCEMIGGIRPQVFFYF